MANLVNPYANPYLPSFVNQRPVMNNQNPLPTPQMNYSGINFGQIHPVKGFDGADAYANSLANGSSEILAEEDPNLARIYIVAKDANGQIFVQGANITVIERPKTVTMTDLSSTMDRILERLDKLEGDKADEQPIHESAWKGGKQSGYATNQSNGRNSTSNAEPTSSNRTNGAK